MAARYLLTVWSIRTKEAFHRNEMQTSDGTPGLLCGDGGIGPLCWLGASPTNLRTRYSPCLPREDTHETM